MAVSLLAGALIGTGAASAIGNFFTGRSQAKAVEKATEQQLQGVRESRAYAEPLYAKAQELARTEFERGRAGLDPYAQQGGQGLTALTALLGLPSAPAAAAPRASAPVAAPVAAAAPAAAAPMNPLGALLTESLQRRAGTAAPATQSSYVSLRAPTGDVRPVPADQVEFYLARGATRA